MPQPKLHQGTDEVTYQSPQIPSAVDVHDVPIVKATDESLKGYGCLVDDPQNFTIENGSFEIVPWPHAGWRSLDPGTGDEGGTTEGAFRLFWQDGTIRREPGACHDCEQIFAGARGTPRPVGWNRFLAAKYR